jgi:hypothetical protein
MIIITRKYQEPDPHGGNLLNKITRKVFADDDLQGIQAFLDERNKISGYEWRNLSFEYTKL